MMSMHMSSLGKAVQNIILEALSIAVKYVEKYVQSATSLQPWYLSIKQMNHTVCILYQEFLPKVTFFKVFFSMLVCLHANDNQNKSG